MSLWLLQLALHMLNQRGQRNAGLACEVWASRPTAAEPGAGLTQDGLHPPGAATVHDEA